MSDLVLRSKDGEIGVITINNPPVNALSPGVPEGILAGIEEFAADPEVQAIIVIGGGRTFIAGADIREFGKITSGGDRKRGPGLNAGLEKIENSPKPVIAAIHGTALGGGLETAMACHYRVGVPSAQVGQPEVKLGIIPGAGGTQRLPRLAGIARAIEMCAGGDPISASEAHGLGIIDQIVEGDLLEGAIAFARAGLADGTLVQRRTRDLAGKLGAPETNAAVFATARDATNKKQRNMLAPQAAISAVEAAATLPFDQGLQRESELFQECLFSDQSKSLIHVFFGEREVAKIPDVPKETPLIPVRKVGIIGAGTMGGGIAMSFANAGIPVILKETEQAALDRGMATITKNYANSVAKGRFSQDVMDRRLGLIQPTLTYDGFGEVDMIIEAVFEGMALKKQIFGELDGIAKPGAILASNTSTLNIDEIASATTRPEMVIGTHFFSPANVMRLLEIVRGRASSKEVIATCMALSKKIGKIGVLVGNCRGFVGNRMFGPYRREAQFLAEEGATPEQIDKALYDYGMAMGPLATGDLAGLDVGWRIRKEFGDVNDTSVRQPLMEDRLCEMGMYGQKTGAGWYKYDEKRRPQHNPEVDRLVEEIRKEKGIEPRAISDQEIIERTLYILVNEGARILEEGFALRSVDIDIIYLNGYGFPAYRGGPMWYADTIGLKEVYERVCEFERQHGKLWTPAPLLKRLAEEGKRFADFAGAAAQAKGGN
ncbi:MAG TPA: 3-hydroxyacyl-CoA dehydrogenase NAD-binding domain-containing protein [Bryobacteraceae bacterium]|nr:3-hydroxyacyl-CoA dehydrogenase NAD-binding domain-containing protein [Bryobacteraceae bacterium]